MKYGVDEDTCTGDHSCIRLSGCPTLTVKDNPDPLRARPGGHRDRRLRRLRPVRRERARGGAVPVVLPRRSRAEPESAGTSAAESKHFQMNLPERPITILIAALGGEGGGVMADWLIEAATQCGFPAQSTSIPGVAQRTGATTYYLEIFPGARKRAGRHASRCCRSRPARATSTSWSPPSWSRPGARCRTATSAPSAPR